LAGWGDPAAVRLDTEGRLMDARRVLMILAAAFAIAFAVAALTTARQVGMERSSVAPATSVAVQKSASVLPRVRHADF
jgi:N-acetylmuramic acid 6-phosphate (MurNAc-6-P) etherase